MNKKQFQQLWSKSCAGDELDCEAAAGAGAMKGHHSGGLEGRMGWICPGTDLNPVQKSVFSLRATEDKEAVEEIWRRRTEMAAIMGLHLRDRRNAKKKKHSRSENKPKESLRSPLIVNLLWCLTLLFVLPGAASLTVEGLKGSSITLPCSLSNREDLTTLLTFGSKIAYGFNQDEHFRGRVDRSGSCDFILHDLKTTDAGKYISGVHDNSSLISSNCFDVHVKVNVSVQKGKELMFDLPREAESVEHLTNASRTEVWSREQGVLTDRLTDMNGRLTIKNFSSSDAGTYRVLNSRGILLTITVTAFSTDPSTGSNDKRDGTHKDKPRDTKSDGVWIGIGIGVVVALVGLIVFAVIMKRWCQNRNKKRDSYKEVQMKDTVQGPSSPNNIAVDIWCAFSANTSFLTQSVD